METGRVNFVVLGVKGGKDSAQKCILGTQGMRMRLEYVK